MLALLKTPSHPSKCYSELLTALPSAAEGFCGPRGGVSEVVIACQSACILHGYVHLRLRQRRAEGNPRRNRPVRRRNQLHSLQFITLIIQTRKCVTFKRTKTLLI